MNNGLTFRSSKIVYYGPHACSQCGVNICKMGQGFGGNAFTYPDGPIYPNTEWHVHVCSPRDILRLRAAYCQERVLAVHPQATSSQKDNLGWQIFADKAALHGLKGASEKTLSGNQTFYDTEDAAWISAKAQLFPTEGEDSDSYDVIKKDLQPRPSAGIAGGMNPGLLR